MGGFSGGFERSVLLVTSLVLAFSFTGCQGANSIPVPGIAGVDPSVLARGKARAQFSITVPKQNAELKKFRPSFVSPATKSLRLSVYATKSNTRVLTTVANLASGDTGCKSGAAGLACIVTFSIAPGKYKVQIATYGGNAGKGPLLSQGQEIPFVADRAKVNKISTTLYGVPRTLVVTPQTESVLGTMRSGFTIGGIWADQRPFNVVALDAYGNAIIGSGAPTFSVSTSNAQFLVSQPTAGAPNLFGVAPRGTVSISTSLTVTASFKNPTVCGQSHAVCQAFLRATYNPFALDDWITFAHDFRRTGVQTQTTEISATTVSSLKQRWEMTVPDSVAGCNSCRVYGSPVVYNGNVIVASYNGVLYDLSAADGSVKWQTTIASGGTFNGGLHGTLLRSAPTIDVADGLVLMGTWTYPSAPSTLYALRLSDGSVAWNQLVRGTIHGSAVYANGVVYEGWSGGDPPNCINGGVSAFDAQTGAIEWTWLTNPVKNPNGGGGIWGALGWDGTHLIFGTGNTCGASNLEQGAVALNANGSTAWSFQADPTLGDDDDTGSGVNIQNGIATFMNKNGSVYSVDANTGVKISSTPLGADQGNGGFATPTVDGGITIAGAGLIADPPNTIQQNDALCWLPKAEFLRNYHSAKRRPRLLQPGYGSFLRAVNTAGSVMWSIPMTNSIDSYVGIDDGVAFAPVDESLDAIAISTGTKLAQFPTDVFEGGPVIVPSGLYMVDYSGHVYAYSLPTATPLVKRSHTR